MLKPTRVNETGLSFLKSWIEATASCDEAGLLQNTDAKALDAWACDAEESMANGNPPMVEMPGNVTKSGAPETFTIPDEGLDFAEVWQAWEDGARDEAVEFLVPQSGRADVAALGADALGVDVSDLLNVARA